MTISELIKVLEEKKSRFGEAEVLVTWEGTQTGIDESSVYFGKEGDLFIDADNNVYKDRLAHPDEPDRLDGFRASAPRSDQEKLEILVPWAMSYVNQINGMKMIALPCNVEKPMLWVLADALCKKLGSGVVVLGSVLEGKPVVMVALVTPDLSMRIHAGKLMGLVSGHLDGRGGGLPYEADATGSNPAGLDKALAAVYETVASWSSVSVQP